MQCSGPACWASKPKPKTCPKAKFKGVDLLFAEIEKLFAAKEKLKIYKKCKKFILFYFNIKEN